MKEPGAVSGPYQVLIMLVTVVRENKDLPPHREGQIDSSFSPRFSLPQLQLCLSLKS